MTRDEELNMERLALGGFAAAIVQTVRKVAAEEHGLPPMATATALISAACVLVEEAAGKEAMLQWLATQREGQ